MSTVGSNYIVWDDTKKTSTVHQMVGINLLLLYYYLFNSIYHQEDTANIHCTTNDIILAV